MKILPAIGLGLIFLYTARCDSTTEKKLVDSINDLTLKLYKELIKTERHNVITSGFSISSALNMLLAGSKGNTSIEINNTLGYEDIGLSEQYIKDTFRKLLVNQIGLNHSGYELQIANSAWIQNGFNVLSQFKPIMDLNFFVEEKYLDFANSSAKDQINSWVSGKTKGRTSSLFDNPLDPSTRLFLANAAYFKGTWVDQFNLTPNVDFISNGIAKAVPMMHIYNRYSYFNDTHLNAQILEIPYSGADVSMIIILPGNNDGLEALENQLTLHSLNEAINGAIRKSLHVIIPKFNISSKLPLNPVLRSLGIVKAFSQLDADFSGINGEKNLYVSDWVQKADIEVNEKGTFTAAAARIIVDPALVHLSPTSFVANHPFLFFIRQKSNGILLFAGRVAQL